MQISKIEENNSVIIMGENNAELLRYRADEKSGNVILSIFGAIRTIVAPYFEEGLLSLLQKTDALTVDFKGISYIASKGLRALLTAQETVDDSENKTLKIINVSPEVMSVFESTGFSNLLDID
jgi:anti-sigma B factor antagonist